MVNEKILILVGVAVVILFFKKISHNFILYSIINLPGTILHEGSHFLASLLTNGHPRSFSVWPKRVESSDGKVQYHLGSVVSYNVRWYNGIFIGLAPLTLGAIAFWIFLTFEPKGFVELALMATVCGLLLEASVPSLQDLKVAFESSGPFVAILVALYLLFPEKGNELWHNVISFSQGVF